jgi:Zn-dependent protease with chaperone function
MLLSTAVLAAITSFAGVYLASRSGSLVNRVQLAMWSLAVIPVSLLVCAISLLGRSPITATLCPGSSGGTLSSLTLSLGVAALGVALLAGVARIALLQRTLRRRLYPAPPELQERADDLAALAGDRRVPVLLLDSRMPIAFASGLLRPRVVLSTWMLEHLDPEEVEAALAHELAHVLGQDCRTIWLATVLRDATCFLPWAWRARRTVVASKELLADDLTVGLTGRPLALASAIVKVWRRSLAGPAFRPGPAIGLSEAGSSLEVRVERLLGGSRGRPSAPSGPTLPFGQIPLAGWLVALSLGLLILCAAL